MSPAEKNTAAPTPREASLAFAETYTPISEDAQHARTRSAELGITPVSQGTAAVLTFLARILSAKTIAEIGTGAGVSTLALLEGMPTGGTPPTIDSESEAQADAKKLLAAAGYGTPRPLRPIAGTALNVLPKLQDSTYDLVFIDGDPLEAVEYVAQASRLLRSGGVMVVNGAFAGDTIADPTSEGDETVIMREVLDAVAEMDELTPMLLPVGDGLLIATRA